MDGSAIAAGILDSNCDRRLWMTHETLGPFDGHDALLRKIRIEADVVQVGAVEAIEIDVHERQSPAAVFMHERERRTGDLVAVHAKPFGESSDERGLTGAEVARQQQDRARPQLARQRTRDVTGFFFRSRGEGPSQVESF
jgi:hypothetical protein